jgi:uncharacterized membrane protein
MPSKKNKILTVFFIAVALIGFTDASYLSIEHFLGETPPCSIVEGCERVLKSEYAKIGPIPLALIGATYYLAVLLLGVLYMSRGEWIYISWAFKLLSLGLLVTAWLIYLQLFVINSICVFCVISAASTLLLFLSSLFILRFFPRESQKILS